MWFNNEIDLAGSHHLFLYSMQSWINIAQSLGYNLDSRFNSVRDSSSYTTVSLKPMRKVDE